MHHAKRLMLLLAMAALSLPLAALADGEATFAMGPDQAETMTLIWKNADTLRMQPPGSPDYLIVRDGKAYSVTDVDGTPQVIAMADMMKMMGAMAGNAAQPQSKTPFGSIASVKATGATETVAGIEGRVHHMTWTDADGSKQSGDAVLTDNPLVVEMTRAYLGSITAIFGSDIGQSFWDAVPGNDRGLLRVSDQFQVKSLSAATSPASTFELPAKPVDLQQIMRGTGGR